jgi:hypothetical protein
MSHDVVGLQETVPGTARTFFYVIATKLSPRLPVTYPRSKETASYPVEGGLACL